MCLRPTSDKSTPAQALAPPPTPEQLKRRQDAIAAAFGIVRGTGIFPEDALEYQREVRAEWR